MVHPQRGDGPRPTWERLYDTALWKNVKKNFAYHKPLRALYCQAQDETTGEQCTRPAYAIDHIIPHKGDMFLFCGGVDYENLQGLCEHHHNKKSALERQSPDTPLEKPVATKAGDVPIFGSTSIRDMKRKRK